MNRFKTFAVAGVVLLTSALLAEKDADHTEDGNDVVYSELEATGRQNEFSDLLDAVLTQFPMDVVDFSWGQDSGTIVVKSSAYAQVERLVAKPDPVASVEIAPDNTIAYVARSQTELAILDLVADIDAVSLAARYDPSEREVVLTVWTDARETSEKQVLFALTRPQPAELVDVEVVVNYKDGSDAPTEGSAIQGGENYGTCTGGFVGNRGSGYGIITAAHCTSKPSSYDGDATGSTYVATGDRDVRFTSLSGGTPENKFRYDFTSNRRTITSTGIVATGANLYKFGKVTGYGVSTVESYEGCVVFISGNQWCYLFYTSNKVTAKGDSGGPWFVANKGYGFTTGSNSGGSYITPIAHVSSIPGSVKVKVS